MSRIIRLVALCVVCFSAALIASDPTYYIKRATWHETIRLSREALLSQRGSDLGFRQRILGPWYVIGPFKAKGASAFSEVFEPERGIDLSKSYDGLQWQKKTDWLDGRVIDLGKDVKCATYMMRVITVPDDTILPVSLGSDDGIKVWINGTEIFRNDVSRGCEPDQEKIDLGTEKGRESVPHEGQ